MELKEENSQLFMKLDIQRFAASVVTQSLTGVSIVLKIIVLKLDT
jgi:hypothetical protein